MANLQIKGIDDGLYNEIKKLAASEKRSVSQQVLFLVKSYLANKPRFDAAKTPSEVFLELHGSWQDEREADQIINQIKKARKNIKRTAAGF
ncbi:MAG: hypothetical protein PVJ29_18545 [Desulfobacterales bacterium]|jgi:hypothetical protein